MAQHAIALPAAGTPPGVWYARATQTPGFNADPAQAKAIARLDHLYHELLAFKAQRSRLFGKTEVFGFSLREQPALPRGVYFWGGVGRGKSLLMDVFFAALPYRRKQRLHFHDFMRDIHRRLAAHLDQHDVDLGLLDEAAALERAGDLLFGAADGEAADLHRTDQRIGDGAAFGHAGIEREVGVLEHQDADGVAGTELVVALLGGLRLVLRQGVAREAGGHCQGQGRLEQGALGNHGKPFIPLQGEPAS